MRQFKGKHRQRGYAAIPYIASFFSASATTGAAVGTTAAAAGTGITTGAAAAAGATAAGTGLGASASAAGLTAAASAGSLAYGALAAKLLSPGAPKIGIPPPPGSAMVDQAASQARQRQRQQNAIAGGINSTITAPVSQGAYAGSTGGGKSLLGQ